MRYTLLLLASVVSLPLCAAEQDVTWPAYGGGPGGGHYSEAKQITPANVDDLEVAWQHRSGDYRPGPGKGVKGSSSEGLAASGFIGTPIVANDTLYYCTPYNRVFALDPQTGKSVGYLTPMSSTNLST